MKILISGGGTGGHIFPAISIANALREIDPSTEFLFVGALGRMEMEKVPMAGYPIVGLPVSGFDRKKIWKNLSALLRLVKSMRKAASVLRDFSPDVVVGVGGYASGPTLRKAASMKIPCLIQEQNSYAGMTNKWLAGKVQTICVAYEGMEKYFPAEKIVFTGNPVRQDIMDPEKKRKEAFSHFDLKEGKPVVLLLGGSLGARTLNRSMLSGYSRLTAAGYQVLWQTGKLYGDMVREGIKNKPAEGVRVQEFITRMDLAYAAADVILSRAGAGTISELCLVGKPVILIPSPNVAEDHQTKNAMALVEKMAALMLADGEADKKMIESCLELLAKPEKGGELGKNIFSLARPGAARHIAEEIIKLKNTPQP